MVAVGFQTKKRGSCSGRPDQLYPIAQVQYMKRVCWQVKSTKMSTGETPLSSESQRQGGAIATHGVPSQRPALRPGFLPPFLPPPFFP